MNIGAQRFFYLIFLTVGFIFLRSSYGKITEGKFVGGLGETLTKFASKNPYPWFKNFLENVAIPNSPVFGFLTMWGELLTGLALALAAGCLFFNRGNRLIYLLLAAGSFWEMLLNGTFWLAAGWTSPSTDGLNLLMFIVGLVGFVFAIMQLNKAGK